MQEQNGLTPAQREIETALIGMIPVGVRIDPIAAAFAAGEKSARRGVRLWQTAAIVLIAGIAMQLISMTDRASSPLTPQSGVAVAVPALPGSGQPFANQSLLVLQNTAMEKGVDDLPALRLAPVQSLRGDGSL